MRCLGLSIAVIAALLVGFSTTEAADWKQYYSNTFLSYETDHDIVHKEYYDSDSIVRTKKGTIKVWTRAVTEGEKDDRPDRIVSLLEIDCSERVYQLLRLTRYYKDNRVEEDTTHINKWDEISPDSNREAVYKVVCQKKKK